MTKSAKISEDGLLGGKVRLLQPEDGYRAAIDPVLLAASIEAKPGEAVLDVGCGVGAAALCLSARLPGVQVTGLEIQTDLAELGERNIQMNAAFGAVAIVEGDLRNPPPNLGLGTFHHAMANPPFMETSTGNPPPNASKAKAHTEEAGSLEDWVTFCAKAVKPKGSVTFIHRADRIDHLLSLMRQRFGGLVVFPLWPAAPGAAAAKPAKRVIVRGRKGLKSPTVFSPGLVLHDAQGAYTSEAEAVLRKGGALTLK